MIRRVTNSNVGGLGPGCSFTLLASDRLVARSIEDFNAGPISRGTTSVIRWALNSHGGGLGPGVVAPHPLDDTNGFTIVVVSDVRSTTLCPSRSTGTRLAIYPPDFTV